MQTPFYRALEATARALGPGPPSAERARRAAQVLDAALDGQAPDAREAPWACRSGCAHCCRHPVGATLDEVLRLAEAIECLPAAERDAVRDRVAAAAAATRDVPWSRLPGLPCPLLQRERCVVHADRPLACRAWASSDADACAQHLGGKAVPLPFDRAAFAAGLGAAAALRGDGGHRELRAALAAVLSARRPAEAAAAFGSARAAGDDAP